jgi:hypothetical protein
MPPMNPGSPAGNSPTVVLPLSRGRSPGACVPRLLLALGLVGGTACASLPSGEPARPDVGVAGLAAADAGRQVLVTFEQRGSWRVPRAGTTARGYDRDYRTSARTRRTVRSLASDYGLHEVSEWPIEVLGIHCVVFEVPAAGSPAEVLRRLRDDGRVESAQPMQLFDTRSGEAAGLDDPYLGLQHGMEATQVTEAHRWAQGTGVRVAIVDTGVDLAHPDLAGHVTLARDFVDDGPPERWSDRHGTTVAGVIASAAGNGLGIVGVAPRVELMALRACWSEDSGASAVCNSFTLAKALAFAVDRRAQVINLSLAGPPDPLLGRLLRAALDRGAVVVAARDERPERSFPCDVPGVLAVRSPGPLTTLVAGATGPDLAAPSVDVLTTIPGGAFDFVSGSSLAAAHVSGIAALLLEKSPGLSAERIADVLAETSRAVDQPGVGPAELVNACAALASVLAGVDCTVPPATTGAG